MPRTAFLDEAVLKISGGRGGNGVASFLRTRRQPKGGPDGGNGGNGGSVYATAKIGLSTLADYVRMHQVVAKNGGHGSGKKQHGANGADVVLELPIGTDIFDEDTGNLHASLLADGEQVLLARGGLGGRGNVTFKTSTNRAPRETTLGEDGEQRVYRLSLRILADIGLIGLPNAGKSSLLNAISNSASLTGDYPFTTLRPQLGAVDLADYSQLTVTDIPGIIAGAASGAGLGIRFLRHITRAQVLLHLVDASSGSSRELAKHIDAVATELELSQQGDLLAKPRVIVLSKIDLLTKAQAKKLQTALAKKYPQMQVCLTSAVEQTGLAELIEVAANLVKQVT